MEHPPKQGLKLKSNSVYEKFIDGFNGTSTKTRIETFQYGFDPLMLHKVLMEHPPKQGLKQRFN